MTTQTQASDESKPVVVFGAIAGIVTVLVVGGLLAYSFTRDNWETKNLNSVLARIQEADKICKTDGPAAYEAYSRVVSEAEPHSVTIHTLRERLEHARQMVRQLQPQVDEIRRRREAEEQRLTEAKRQAEQRQQEQAARQEMERQAEEQRREREKAEAAKCREFVKKYASAPPSAHDAVKALTKLQARTEVGISYVQYGEAVGVSWGEIKSFVESPHGTQYPELSWVLLKAIDHYREARTAWEDKIEHKLISKEAELQQHWREGGLYAELASGLLNPNQCEAALIMVRAQMNAK